jgi:hypothetical protein
MSGFEVSTSNSVYEVNVGTSFGVYNNVKSCTPLYVLTLNPDHKMNSIHFIWYYMVPIPYYMGSLSYVIVILMKVWN